MLQEGSTGPWPAEQVAHLRTFTDIPYAAEFARISESQNFLPKDPTEAQQLLTTAPRFELRFKSVTTLALHQSRPEKGQILELAVGLSPRGLIMTEGNSLLRYVETDLAREINRKQRFVKMILDERGDRRPHLTFRALNVTDTLDYLTIKKDLHGPLTVISEGLRPIAHKFVSHVHRLLSILGGVWITPDFVARREWVMSFGDQVTSSFAFKQEEDVLRFLSNSGFRVETFLQLDLVPLDLLKSLSHPTLGLVAAEQARRYEESRVRCLYPK